MKEIIIMTLVIFLYGIIVGSFLNVCILRIPEHKSVITERSHCMSCGYQLKWYDLFPVFSYLFLKGRCRKCGEKISIQYPIIETVNGVLWLISYYVYGLSVETIVMCLVASALLVLSIIDFRTFEIPLCINVFIAVIGAAYTILDKENWQSHLLGLVVISVPLYIIFLVSRGRGIGGGDVKLMAAAGLVLGVKLIIPAFMFGCLFGSVIHIVRMKVSNEGKVLAMGPYLSMGILTAFIWGEGIVEWYVSFF